MIEIRRILCPVDFSEPSRHALEHAVAIAKSYHSSITALHVVYVPLFPQPPIFMVPFVEAVVAVAPTPQTCEEELQTWLAPARQAGVPTEVAVAHASHPAGPIVEHAGARRADLIVMGTHGLSGFDRLLLGSVCEKVLRKAPCPVLTVPPAAVAATALPYGRLLCPVDFSDSSLEALRYACSLAAQTGAALTIVHAVEQPPDDEVFVERFDAPGFSHAIDASARTRLEALVPGTMRTARMPSIRIEHGKPYQRVLDIAAEEHTDLIVIGVRGRNPVDLRVFGSTTNQVVRRAACPVLTLRRE